MSKEKPEATTVVKSGKSSVTAVTSDTVRLLERVGSSESAKIARSLVKKSSR